MGNIIMDTKSEAVAASQVMVKGMSTKEVGSNTASSTAGASTSVAVSEISVNTTEAAAPVEATTEEAVTEGATDAVVADTAVDTPVTDNATVEGEVGVGNEMPVDTGVVVNPGYDEGMYTDPMMETGVAEVKDPLLSSWPFVIGISSAVLLISIAFGFLLARRKIKKGIELYED